MATKTAPTAADLALATTVSEYQGMTVAQLRKLAAGKISDYSRKPKAALISALVDHDVKAERHDKAAPRDKSYAAEKYNVKPIEDAPKPTKATDKEGKPFKSTKAPKVGPVRHSAGTKHVQAAKAKAKAKGSTAAVKATRGDDGKVKGQMCAVCGTRRKDNRTQGRDSTMCRPCYDFAGWENTHVDEGHAGIADGSTKVDNMVELAEIEATMKICPVCAGADPAKTKPKSRAPKKAPTKPNTSKPVDGIDHPKAAKFAGAAKDNGWKVGSFETRKGISTLVVTAAGGEWIEISWEGNRCCNTGTTHKGTDGKVRHVRNASAARQILEG